VVAAKRRLCFRCIARSQDSIALTLQNVAGGFANESFVFDYQNCAPRCGQNIVRIERMVMLDFGHGRLSRIQHRFTRRYARSVAFLQPSATKRQTPKGQLDSEWLAGGSDGATRACDRERALTASIAGIRCARREGSNQSRYGSRASSVCLGSINILRTPSGAVN
jgi:hypothetical protein